MSDQFSQHVQQALEQQNLGWPPGEVVKFLRVIERSLGKNNEQNKELLLGIAELAKFIEQTKKELSAIRPDEIKSTHIPTATDELDAIVEATEVATGTIMDCCEHIEQNAAVAEESVRDSIVGEVTKIYEACTFQDITGQRISKVVKALKSIDAKVSALLKAFGAENISPAATETKPAVPDDDGHLLNGPQMKGQGVTQDDIVKLLSS